MSGWATRESERWTDSDRAIARRSTGGPFLGADVPADHLGQIQKGLAGVRQAGELLDAPCFLAVTRGPDHVLVNVNPTFYRVAGPRRLLGRPLRAALPELAARESFQLLDRVFATGEARETGLLVVPLYLDPRDPGHEPEERWIACAHHPLSDDRGATDGILVAGVDLTRKIQARSEPEIRRVREELRESTRPILEPPFASSDAAVLMLDPGDWTILACNPTATETFGYSRKEMVGRSTRMLHLDRESYLDFRRRSERGLTEEGVFRDNLRLRRKDGRVIPTEQAVSRLAIGDAAVEKIVSVVRDLSHPMEREEQIQTRHRRLQSLSRELLQVREEERERIARHLHDVVGQTLTAVKFNLDAVRTEADSIPERDRLEEAVGMLGDSIQRLRDLSVELRPSILDDLGLLPALRWYLDRLGDRVEFGIVLDVAPEVSEIRLAGELQTQAFRITQEALLNVARHAEAARVRVGVRVEDDHLSVSVSDDGRGFDPEPLEEPARDPEKLGLLGMEERASLVNGELAVESRPGEGTTVLFRAPVRTEGHGERRRETAP